MNFFQSFSNLINAGFPYIYIPSYEEERVTESIRSALAERNLVKTERRFYIWTQTDGLISDGKKIRDTSDSMKMLQSISKLDDNAVFLLKDFYVYFGADRGSRPDYAIIRKLRDLLPILKASRKTVVFLSPKLVIPCDMEKEISVLDYELPGIDEMTELLDNLMQDIHPENVNLTAEDKILLARSALGLTIQEAENAFCRAIVQLKGLNRSAVSIIHEEKKQVVKKTGVLEFVKTDLDMDDTGGLDNLKT